MRKLNFFLLYLIFFVKFLECKTDEKIFQLKFLIITHNSNLNQNIYNQVLQDKTKYNAKIFIGKLFSLTNIKNELKILNKFKPDIYLFMDEPSDLIFKKVKKYQKNCRFPILLTNAPKKYEFIFKNCFFLNLLKLNIKIYNLNDRFDFEKLQEVSHSKFKKSDVNLIFLSNEKLEKEDYEALKKYDNLIFLLKNENDLILKEDKIFKVFLKWNGIKKIFIDYDLKGKIIKNIKIE